jgi:hypothetical protein
MELLFFAACGFVGMLPTIVALLLKRNGIATTVALVWFAVSALMLQLMGLGPHGFILFAFIPFWAGNLATLIWALIRFNKGRAAA